MLRRFNLRWCLFLVVATLVVGVAKAQNIPEWKKGPLGKDSDGNRIIYWQDFEDQQNPPAGNPAMGQAYVEYWEKSKNDVKPVGWTDSWETSTYRKSSNNVFIKWMVKAQGGKSQPRRSYGVKGEERGLHLRYFAYDDQAFSAVILPAIDLRSKRVQSPTLKFQFASPARTQCDKLVVKFRVEKYGDYGGWHELASYQEQNEEFVLKAISLADAFKNFKKKNGTTEALDDKHLAKVELYFEGHTKLGGGLNIDDIMIVDVNDNPLKLGQTDLQQLTNPVGQGTDLNEIARISFDVTTGYGFYKLEQLSLPFEGNAIGDVTSFSLYHTSTPYFSSQAANKFCDLQKSGNQITLGNVTDDLEHRILPGSHHFWVVANVSNTAVLKNKISVKFPAEAIKLKFFREQENNQIHVSSGDRAFPKTEQYDNKRFCTVYACLMKDNFEGASTADWTLSNSWQIGKPVQNAANSTFKSAPTEAFSGQKVLATAKISDKPEETGNLDGYYSDDVRFEQTPAKYSKSTGIDAQFYKDIRFKAKYCLNSKPDDKFRLVVITDANAAEGIPVDIETVVWENTTRTVMSGWNTMNIDLSKAATRNKKFRFRFEFETKSDNENESGLFLDDIQILGDLIKKDIGILKVETPKGFDLNTTTPLKVTVKNYGKENITGGYKIKVTLNGVTTVQSFTNALNTGATQEHSITGLNLAPDPNLAISNEKHLIVEVELNSDADDDTANNTYVTKFYSFPTYDIASNSTTKRYPKKDRFDRLMHWYPEAAGVQYTSSWTETFVDTQAKFKDKSQYTTNVPYSYQVWTTGLPHSNLNEQSTLTGPIFNLEGTDKKEFIVGFIYEKDQSTQPATFYFEYSQDGINWNVLKKETGKWTDNWYDTPTGWTLNDTPEHYKIAKVELPITTGKIQIRAHFKGMMPFPGVTISGFEVREMRPDLQITAFSQPATGGCDRLGDAKLKIKIKNNGPVDLQPFSCPVTVRVYKYLNERAYSNPKGKEFTELLGSHTISLSLTALAVGAEGEFETDISYPWDVEDWGYYLEAELHPETTNDHKADENATNNTYTASIVSLFPYFPIIENLAPITPYVYYVDKYPTMIAPWIQKERQNHFEISDYNWTIISGNVVKEGNMAILANGDARVKLTYKIKSKFPQYKNATPPKECNKELVFDIKKTQYTIQVKEVEFTDQSDKKGENGCFKTGGETLKVTIVNIGEMPIPKATLKVFINGVEQTLSTISVNNLTQKQESTITLSGVKIPKGFSQLEIVAVNEDDKANVSMYAYRFRRDRIYRAEPVEPKLYWRNAAFANAITPVPPSGILNSYVGHLVLFVTPIPGATYQWYKGNADVTTFNGLSPIEGATKNELDLPDESATYAVKITYGACGAKESKLVHVRTDDLELVAFNGVALSGVCAAQGKLPLLVDIRNNSRTEYPEGTKLRFKLKVTPKITPLPSGITPYDQTFDYVLTSKMTPQAVNTLEIITLTDTQYASGDNDFELEFMGIVTNGVLVPDGNRDNDKLLKRVSVNPSPVVTINPNEIRQKFSASENFTITPTYSGASQAVRYEWASKDEEDHDYTPEAGNNPNFTVNGSPKDMYRVTAYNAQGCSSEATVKFIQTDLELSNIVSPSSACDLGLASNDYVDFTVTNSGSKKIKNLDAKLKVNITLNGAQLKEEDLEIPSTLREVGKSMNLRVSVAGLKEKLKATSPHTLKVTIALMVAEDIVATNNEQQVELKSYGNPDFTMNYDKRNALSTSTVSTDIPEGSKVEYYSSEGSTFRFSVTGSPADTEYEWAYAPDNFLSSIEDIVDGAGNVLKGQSTTLPHEKTKERSKDKMGTGFYYLSMRTPEGCSTRKYFELVVIRQDIEVVGVQAPVSACDFTGTQTVSVNVSNVGTKLIPRDTKVTIAVEFYTDKAMTASAKKHTLTQEHTVETDWLVGSVITVPLTFSYQDATWKADGSTFYIKAHVEFAEQEQKELEFTVANNDYKYEDLTLSEPGANASDEEKKKYQAALAKSKCVFADWQNVTVDVIKAHDLEGTTITPLSQNGTYEYNFMKDSNENYVTLDADQNNCAYDWVLGFGIQKHIVPPATSVPTDQQTITVKGAGKFELRLQTAESKLGVGQTKDKACKAMFTGYIATKGNDIYFANVESPASESCLENSQGTEIIFTLRNTQPIEIASATPEPTITFTYSFTKGGNPTDLLGSHGEYEAKLQDIVSRFNSSTIPDYRHIAAKSDIKVNLSNLAGVTIPKLTETGSDYKLKISFKVNAPLTTFDIDDTNAMETTISYLGEAQLPAADLGGASQQFYAPTAVLQVDEQKLNTTYEGYNSFVWMLPNGTSQPSANSKLTITDPGAYKLSFKDKAGCNGSTTVQVKFPGYLQFAPEAIVAPVKGCDILHTQPVVTFKVKNEGKEVYTIPTSGIPVQMKLWDATQPEPPVWGTGLLHGKTTPMTIAPGETKEVTSVETLTFQEAANNLWNLKLNLKSSTDGSHNPTLGIEHPVAEAQVTDNPFPKKPDLAAQARAYLEAHGVPAPVDLLEVPRGVTFSFDANGNTAGETYEWTTPATYSGVKDASSLEFNTSGMYKVKVTSGEGCATESDEVKLRYKVEYKLLPVLQEDMSSYCVKKGVSTTEYIVKVKVTIEKADELIPAGTTLTFNYRVTNNTALVDQATEHLTIEENLAAGKTIEYTFTKHISMPRGTNKVELTTSFDYFGKNIEGTGSKELRYVEGPAITINPKYESNEPVVLKPIVEGGTAPYKYSWNGVEAGATYEAEGGTVTILVTDQNGCTDEATTEVSVYHTLTIDKKGEGDLKVQMYKEDGVQFENQLLNDGDRIYHGRKLKITALPNVAKKAILEYMLINEDKIPVDKTGKEHILEKVTGNVKLEVRFKSEGGTAVEDARLAEVVCVSPIAMNLTILHTEAVVAYDVLNANGVMVASGKNADGIDQIVVDAKAMRSGMYIVRVYSDTGAMRVIKVVKE